MISKIACFIACLSVLAQISLAENQLRPKSELFQRQARQLAEDDDDAFALKIPTVSPVTVNPPVMELPTREIPTPSIPQPSGNNDIEPVAAPPTSDQASVRPTPSENNIAPGTPILSDQPVLSSLTTAPIKNPQPNPSPAVDLPTPTEGDSVPTPSESEDTTTPNIQENESSIPTIDIKDTENPTVDSSTTERSSAPSLSDSILPTTTAAPSTSVLSTTNPTSAKPSIASPDTIAPSTMTPSTFAPSAEKTEQPTVAKTERPTEAPTEKTERPTEAPTEKTAGIPIQRSSFPTLAKVAVTEVPTTLTPTTDTPTTLTPTTDAPTTLTPTTDTPTTDIPTAAPSLEQTSAPSIETGTGDNGNNDPQQGGTTDDPALDPDANSSSSVTFFLIAVILFVLYVLYRLYCKSVVTASSNTGSNAAVNYSRLSTDEVQSLLEDGLGDVEMAAHTAGYDDDAEIWEEWETNEEVNPPKTFLQVAATTTIPPIRSASPSSIGSNSGIHLGMKNSHSREDIAPASTTTMGTVNKSNVPILAKPPSPVNTTSTTSNTLSLGMNKSKTNTATGSSGHLSTSAATTSNSRSGKTRSVTTPPASDVDLFASIGIAAAPKFSNNSTLGGFPVAAVSQGQSKSSKSNTNSRNVTSSKPIISTNTTTPAASVVPVVLSSSGPSRVSAVNIGSDSEGGGGGGTWDDDKELDDLIGDD